MDRKYHRNFVKATVIASSLFIFWKLFTKKSKTIIVLVSGKRCSGKDFICDIAVNNFQANGISSKKISHSSFVKQLYCEKTGVNLQRLLSDRSFKEKHRNKMIEMAQKLQQKDPHVLSHYIRKDIKNYNYNYNNDNHGLLQLVLISDFRRKFEQTFFEKYYCNVLTLRINASESTRKNRGWNYDEVKDTRYTECELDDKMDWNFVFDNNDNGKEHVCKFVKQHLWSRVKQIVDS